MDDLADFEWGLLLASYADEADACARMAARFPNVQTLPRIDDLSDLPTPVAIQIPINPYLLLRQRLIDLPNRLVWVGGQWVEDE